MKNLIMAILMATAFTLTAQDNDSYTMFSTLYLTPAHGQMEELINGIKAHKADFHPGDSPHAVTIFRIMSGPRSGDLIWLEGPQMFSDLDKGLGDGHGPDWGKNIDPHLADYGATEYWKRLDEYSREGTPGKPLVMVRFLEVNIKDRQGYRMFELFRQLSEAIKSLPGDFSWNIYSNEFQQGKLGRHFSIVSTFDSWTDLEKSVNALGNRPIKDEFEKIHGEGSFENWQRAWQETFADSYDELLMRMDW